MTLATHAAVGAIIASRFPSHPITAFCLAFVSHFVLDTIPHKDYELGSLSRSHDNDAMKTRVRMNAIFRQDLLKVGLDVLIGFVVALFLLYGRMPLFTMAVGIAGAILPDFLQFLYFGLRTQPLVILEQIHVWFHTKNRMENKAALSFVSQAVLVALCYLVLRYLG